MSRKSRITDIVDLQRWLSNYFKISSSTTLEAIVYVPSPKDIRSSSFNGFLVPQSRRFGRPFQGFVIHVADSESFRVPVFPFEIVQERPGKVALQQNTGIECLSTRSYVSLEVVFASGVVFCNFKTGIVFGSSILGNDNRNVLVSRR